MSSYGANSVQAWKSTDIFSGITGPGKGQCSAPVQLKPLGNVVSLSCRSEILLLIISCFQQNWPIDGELTCGGRREKEKRCPPHVGVSDCGGHHFWGELLNCHTQL